MNALIEAGQISATWTALGMCPQRGFKGPAVDGLIQRLSLSAEGNAVSAAPAAETRGGMQRNPTAQDVSRFNALYNKGRYGDAIKLARTLTQRYPSSAQAWRSAMHKDGQSLEAIEPLARATAARSERHRDGPAAGRRAAPGQAAWPNRSAKSAA